MTPQHAAGARSPDSRDEIPDSSARKQLSKLPAHIVRKFALWVDLVRFEGLDAARAVPGFRDHAPKGQWQGYRAVRLSDPYRAIYIVRSDDVVETVYVEEVNKHGY